MDVTMRKVRKQECNTSIIYSCEDAVKVFYLIATIAHFDLCRSAAYTVLATCPPAYRISVWT